MSLFLFFWHKFGCQVGLCTTQITKINLATYHGLPKIVAVTWALTVIVQRIIKIGHPCWKWASIPILYTFLMGQTFAETPSLEALTGQWLDLERQKGAIQQQWGERKSYLQQRIELLQIERDSLQDVKRSANDSIAKIDQERNDLLEDQLRLERESELLANSIAHALTNLNQLAPKFPPPLSDQWQNQIAALDIKKSLSEKLEFVLSVYKSVGEFDQRIVLHRGPITLDGEQGAEQTIMVNQVYMGITHGWYVGDDHTYFGYGNSENGSWQWWHGSTAQAKLEVNFDAGMVDEVVRILQEPTQAKYVTLPISFTPLGEAKP